MCSVAYMEGVLCLCFSAAQPWLIMDFQGQKMAERLMLYIICIAGLVAFCMGWLEGSFALMMKVGATSTGTFTAAFYVKILYAYALRATMGSLRLVGAGILSTTQPLCQLPCTGEWAAIPRSILPGERNEYPLNAGIWWRRSACHGGMYTRLALVQLQWAPVAAV